MKILRVRRGFTTNSSGTNEYLPAPTAVRPGDLSAYALQATAAGSDVGPLAAIGHSAGSAGILGLLGLGVLGTFLLDRLLRRRRKGTEE